MAKYYYCPYCQNKDIIREQNPKVILICGTCGEQVIKIQPIRATQVFSILLASAFLAPLIAMILTFIQKPIQYEQRQIRSFERVNTKI